MHSRRWHFELFEKNHILFNLFSCVFFCSFCTAFWYNEAERELWRRWWGRVVGVIQQQCLSAHSRSITHYSYLSHPNFTADTPSWHPSLKQQGSWLDRLRGEEYLRTSARVPAATGLSLNQPTNINRPGSCLLRQRIKHTKLGVEVDIRTWTGKEKKRPGVREKVRDTGGNRTARNKQRGCPNQGNEVK